MSMCPLGTTKDGIQCLGQSLVVRCLFTEKWNESDVTCRAHHHIGRSVILMHVHSIGEYAWDGRQIFTYMYTILFLDYQMSNIWDISVYLSTSKHKIGHLNEQLQWVKQLNFIHFLRHWRCFVIGGQQCLMSKSLSFCWYFAKYVIAHTKNTNRAKAAPLKGTSRGPDAL